MINAIFGIFLSSISGFILLHINHLSITSALSSGALLGIVGFILFSKLNKVSFNLYLKILTLALISAFVLFAFSQIGLDLMLQQSVKISTDIIIIVGSFVIALFLYYLLLSEGESKQVSLNNKPSIVLCLLVAFVLTILQMLLIKQLQLTYLEQKILMRGIIPPISILMFNWGLLLLLGRLLLLLRIKNPNVELSHYSKSFFVFPSYINYALPILGFIGTVLGISLSSTGIAQIIASPDGLSSGSQNLGDAIAPLGIAFDTTLVALSLSLIFSLFLVLLESFENRRLDVKKTL
jgi:hypothetical protein